MEKHQEQLRASKMDGLLNPHALVSTSMYCYHYTGDVEEFSFILLWGGWCYFMLSFNFKKKYHIFFSFGTYSCIVEYLIISHFSALKYPKVLNLVKDFWPAAFKRCSTLHIKAFAPRYKGKVLGEDISMF